MCIPFLLLIALANCAHLLATCLLSKNGVLYSEGRAYKRAPELVASPHRLTPFYRQQLCEEQCNKNEVCHNSTRGIVSLCYFSR